MTSGALSVRLDEGVRSLAPHYFALVMGSGIVSVGLTQHGQVALSWVPLAVGALAYAVLVVLNVWRVVRHRDAVLEDVTDPARAFGFFTFIAGTNVLGVRLAIAGRPEVTLVLLVLATVTWIVSGYLVPWMALLGHRRRPVLAEANGSWFIWIVASQSVATAAAVLEPEFTGARIGVAALAIFAWSVGTFLYAAVGVMVSTRLLLYELRAEQITPPYWVAMGAAAISVLAGARIIEMQPTPMVLATRGLISGVVVIMWAFATWLIPALVAFGWWRHRRHRVMLTYDPALWSIVFPLGMYAVAGTYLGRADELPLVRQVGAVMIWVAFAVWVVTFLAMLRHLARTFLLPARG
jgi:tellurite resistance protein TehA-like permease